MVKYDFSKKEPKLVLGDLTLVEGVLHKKLKSGRLKPVNTTSPYFMVKGVSYRIEDIFWYVYTGELPDKAWEARRIAGPGTELTKANLVRVMTWPGALSKEFIRSHFTYDPETGSLERKYIAYSKKHEDEERYKGYGGFSVGGQHMQAHTLIWWYMLGRKIGWDHVIDHKDGNPANWKWENLREITQSMNMMNWWSHRNHNQPREF